MSPVPSLFEKYRKGKIGYSRSLERDELTPPIMSTSLIDINIFSL